MTKREAAYPAGSDLDAAATGPLPRGVHGPAPMPRNAFPARRQKREEDSVVIERVEVEQIDQWAPGYIDTRNGHLICRTFSSLSPSLLFLNLTHPSIISTCVNCLVKIEASEGICSHLKFLTTGEKSK